MGSNVYLNTKNHEKIIKAGLIVSEFVNGAVEVELKRHELECENEKRREQREQGV